MKMTKILRNNWNLVNVWYQNECEWNSRLTQSQTNSCFRDLLKALKMHVKHGILLANKCYINFLVLLFRQNSRVQPVSHFGPLLISSICSNFLAFMWLKSDAFIAFIVLLCFLVLCQCPSMHIAEQWDLRACSFISIIILNSKLLLF